MCEETSGNVLIFQPARPVNAQHTQTTVWWALLLRFCKRLSYSVAMLATSLLCVAWDFRLQDLLYGHRDKGKAHAWGCLLRVEVGQVHVIKPPHFRLKYLLSSYLNMGNAGPPWTQVCLSPASLKSVGESLLQLLMVASDLAHSQSPIYKQYRLCAHRIFGRALPPLLPYFQFLFTLGLES